MSGVIGIDLGVTRVAVALLRDREPSEPLVRPTERSDTDALVGQIAELVDQARTDDVAAVGVGVARVAEFETGRVIAAGRPPWPGGNSAVDLPPAHVPPRHVLEERRGLPVLVDHRTSVSAPAEAHDEP